MTMNKCTNRSLRLIRSVSFKFATCYWKPFLLVVSGFLVLQYITHTKYTKSQKQKVRQLFLPMKSFNNCQTFHRELSSLEEDFARLSCADDKYFQTPDIVHVLPSSANVMQSFCAKSRSKDEDRDSIKQSPKHQARNCEDIPNYPIITIVPYYGRVNHLKIFLENFRLLMSRDEMLYLVISTIGRDVKTVNETIIRIFSAADVSRIFIIQDLTSSPSRGRLRNLGAKHATTLFGNDAHLLFTDVDIMISRKFIKRCRILTYQKDSVYFPIVWSEKRPNETGENRTYNFKTHGEFASFIQSTNGYWRDRGYGMVCTSGENFNKYGHFPEFETWGLEDKFLFFQMADAGLRVHRFNESGLIHKWHPKDCSADNDVTKQLCEKIKKKNED